MRDLARYPNRWCSYIPCPRPLSGVCQSDGHKQSKETASDDGRSPNHDIRAVHIGNSLAKCELKAVIGTSSCTKFDPFNGLSSLMNDGIMILIIVIIIINIIEAVSSLRLGRVNVVDAKGGGGVLVLMLVLVIMLVLCKNVCRNCVLCVVGLASSRAGYLALAKHSASGLACSRGNKQGQPNIQGM